MNVIYVPFGELANATAAILPYMKQAAGLTDGNCIVDDMMARLYNKQQQLWAVVDEGAVLGIMTSEIMNYPQCKKLRLGSIVLDPGTLEKAKPLLLSLIDDFARENACVGIEFAGRTGWERTLRDDGYTKSSLVYTKELNHG